MTRTFIRHQVQGAAIQGAALLASALQGFLAPKVLGAHGYGLATSVLTLPYLSQAFLEPIIVPLTIRWSAQQGADGPQRLATLRRQTVVWGAGAVVASFGVGFVQGTRLGTPGAVLLATTAAAFLALAVVTTHLMACAYAREKYGAVARAYVVAAVAFLVALPLLHVLGALGMTVALCGVQVLAIVSLLRAHVWQPVGPGTAYPSINALNSWREDYLPVLSPRLAQLALNPGTVVLASAYMSPPDLGAYRLTVSLVAAGSYLVPIAPALLQRSVQQNSGVAVSKERKAGAVVLAAGFLLSCGITGVLWRWGPVVRASLLGSSGHGWSRFDVMFWALPFYAVMPALSGYLIGLGRHEKLLEAFVACSAVLGVAAIVLDLPVAFTVATGTFVVCATVMGGAGLGGTLRRCRNGIGIEEEQEQPLP